MESSRRTALITGVFFVITFITSIPAVILYGPLLTNGNYLAGAGADPQVSLAALLEILLAIANIGTAVTLFPLLKNENEGVALGYVASRTVESSMILVGAIALVSVVTLRLQLQAGGATGADLTGASVVARSLVAVHDWTFLMGPGFAVSVNDLLLGYLLYRTELVPRWLALLGMVGGPVLFVAMTGRLFGLFDAVSVPAGLATIPVFVFEGVLGLWLIVRGFNTPAVMALLHRAESRQRPAH